MGYGNNELMPANYREVLVLRHLENHAFPAIAQRMDLPLENVKSLWQRGIMKLRAVVIGETPNSSDQPGT